MLRPSLPPNRPTLPKPSLPRPSIPRPTLLRPSLPTPGSPTLTLLLLLLLLGNNWYASSMLRAIMFYLCSCQLWVTDDVITSVKLYCCRISYICYTCMRYWSNYTFFLSRRAVSGKHLVCMEQGWKTYFSCFKGFRVVKVLTVLTVFKVLAYKEDGTQISNFCTQMPWISEAWCHDVTVLLLRINCILLVRRLTIQVHVRRQARIYTENWRVINIVACILEILYIIPRNKLCPPVNKYIPNFENIRLRNACIVTIIIRQ